MAANRFLLLHFLLIWTAATVTGFAAGRQKTVLLFYGTRNDLQVNQIADRSIREVLNDQSDAHLDIRSEYLDWPSRSKADDPALMSWLRRKYAVVDLDVVVALGTTALQFVREHHQDIFHDAPILYWGRHVSVMDSSGAPFAAVVAPEIGKQIRSTLEFIHTLQPDVERLFVVSGTSDIASNWEAATHHELGFLADGIGITYLSGMSVYELSQTFRKLPKHAAVLFLTMGEDAAGQRLKEEVLSKLVAEATAPIYSTSIIHLATGIVGGPLIDQQTMAVDTARQILRLLSGETIREIGIKDSAAVSTVNSRALARWDIPDSRLPRGTVIKYREPSAWDLYKWQWIATATLCLVEAALIAGLLVQRRMLKQSHAAQQQLTGLLLHAQDDARRGIARDLHDTTVQDLAAIRAYLSRMEVQSAWANPTSAKTIQEGISLCDKVIKELRTVSYVLHPPMLDEAGLIPALKWFVNGFMERSGIKVELVVMEDVGRLGTEAETALFRVVQECLTNIRRHSGSKTAVIWVTREKETVRVQITDEGHGFSLPAGNGDRETPGVGVGIMGMRQRLKQFGGDLQIESSSEGTTVKATIAVQGGQDGSYSLG